MRIKPMVAVAFAAALVASTSAGAATITLFNTGVNGSGTVLGQGASPDTHYTLIPPGGTTVTEVWTAAGGFPVGPYLGDDTLSAWIGPNLNSPQPLYGPGGIYDYRTTFDLTGLNPSTASITGLWSSDNDGLYINLNGVNTENPGNPYGPPYSFTHWAAFSISSGFQAGVNTLDFYVMNGNGDTDTAGPTSLRVEMTGTASATPLPSTWTMLLAGFVGLGFFAYRGTKKNSAALAAA
jgi:hypothetical protein